MTEQPKLPRTLRVGPIVYQVKLTGQCPENVLGLTDLNASNIKINPAQAGSQMRVTVLHEALHAINWAAGVEQVLGVSSDDEERLVRMQAAHLLAVLRDNPRLVTYLLAP